MTSSVGRFCKVNLLSPKPSLRDRVAVRVVLWCVDTLPSKTARGTLRRIIELGAIVHTDALLQVQEYERSHRADT